MKNILILIAVISTLFISCSRDDGYYGHPDGSQGPNVSGSVGIQISVGSPGGGAPVTPAPLPIGTAWTKYPINNSPQILFCPYLQPTEYFSVPLDMNNSFVGGCIDLSLKSAINSQVASQGGNYGDWVLVSTITLSCDYTAEQIIGFAPYRLMQNPQTGKSEWAEQEDCPEGMKEIKNENGSRVWVPLDTKI